MRVCVRAFLVLACLLAVQSTASAQAVLAGAVRDSSGALLPGVTVEAASPELIEKVRTTVTDSAGRYRIEDLRPGTYSVTFTLAGFATLKRDGVIVSGSAVIAIDADLRVGGVQETITVTGETPVVDIQSTKREITLDNETLRNLPSVRSYSYLLTVVPGLQTNNNNVNTGPVFAIFPIHGGRGVESRLTVDGLNISNPPGGNQPPNFTADIGNAQEVTMITSGGLGEIETAGLTMNIVPKQGGNRFSGLAFVSGFSENMLSDNFTPELQARGATQPTPVVPRVRRQHVGRRPDRAGQTLVLRHLPRAGVAAEHAERVLQHECRQRERVDLRARPRQTRVLRSHVGELHATHHVADFGAQQDLGLVGRAACLPQLHGHDIADRLAQLLLPHLAGGRRPRRVQPAAHPAGEVDLTGHQPAAPRSRVRHDLLRVGRQGARERPEPESGAGGEPHAGDHTDGDVGHAVPLAELVEQQDERHHSGTSRQRM